MANDENKFLPIFQILDIKNVSFLLKLEMALATTIRMKFEPVCIQLCINSQEDLIFNRESPQNFRSPNGHRGDLIT